MPQSLVKNLIHLVYSTKNRNPWIPRAVQGSLFAYQAGIFKNQERHHRELTFQDKLRALFERHEIEFNERYVWD